jgi:hypothetical protein
MRAKLRLDGQVGFSLGIDDEESVLAFADAGGFNALERTANEMHLASLAAVHGRKAVRHAGLANLFSRGFGGHTQFLGAKGLKVGGVEADEVVLVVFEVEYLRA